MGEIYAPHENEEGLVYQNVAPPQHQMLCVLGSESEESDGEFGCDGRMKRMGSRCVYLGEAFVVVQTPGLVV